MTKKEKKFVFFSKKRAKHLKFYLALSAIVSAAFIYLAYLGFTQPTFADNFSRDRVEKIVHQLSTRDPGKIVVGGVGPILDIQEQDGDFALTKTTPNLNKTVFLTFDDGPTPQYTSQVLKILKDENIKATFFVVGQNAYQHPDLIKQIVTEGHMIGAHTFTHVDENVPLVDDELRLYYEFELTQRTIEQNTGHSTKLFRMPYWGREEQITFNTLVLAANAVEQGYFLIGTTVDTNDWEAKSPQNILDQAKLQNDTKVPVVLLHDGGGDRSNTVKALPALISFYRQQGYNFATADQLLPGETVFPKVSRADQVYSAATFTTYDLYQKAPGFLTIVFFVGLGIFIIHSIFILVFALLHRIKEGKIERRGRQRKPRVSVVIPVFNEEKVIQKTLDSVLASDYPNFEIVVVDDGSKDDSAKIIKNFINKHKVKDKVFLIQQENQGKFSALNAAFSHSSGEIIVAVDADTLISPKAIKSFMYHFRDPKMAAVAGNIKVGNQVNFLTKLQEVDYRLALNLERRAFSYLNSVYVVPGAISAWRRDAVLEADGFSEVTLTEDGELGMRLKKLGYSIDYESKAVAYTEAPEKLGQLWRQRFRWTFGALQTLWLHKDMIGRPKYGFLGVVLLPYTIFIQIPFLAISPLIELIAIPVAIFGSTQVVTVAILSMIIIRFVLFLIASRLGGENTKLAAYVIPYRFFYQFLWYFVLDLALLTALRGSFIAWKKMDRTGQVQVEENLRKAVTYSEIRNN